MLPDVIGHDTIRTAVGGFLFVPHLYQPCILYGFRDIEPQIFWGHGVIGHATIRLALGGFL